MDLDSSPVPPATAQRLPRLVYIGDVQVENTRAGSVQLFRLLNEYPVDRLRIIQSDLFPAGHGEKLPGVSSQVLKLPWRRLLTTRFQSLYASYLFLSLRFKVRKLARSIRDWEPDAILAVAGNYTWLAAAGVAESLGIPLHLIIHDDPAGSMFLPKSLRAFAEKRFETIYRQAASRLCVCNGMAQIYRERFGLPAQVLYPLRAPKEHEFDDPPPRLRCETASLTFAYAGSVNGPACAAALTMLADVLEPLGHRFLLFSDWGPDIIRKHRLDRTHVSISPLAPPGQLISKLRQRADVLFTPISFEPDDFWNTQLSFPSKLSDYTVAGIPLLIWGPPYSSAILWAKESPDTAIIVTDPRLQCVTSALGELKNPERRYQLGSTAMRKGNKCFSYQAARHKFFSALTGETSQAQNDK